MPHVRNPAAEAAELVGPEYTVRVLEPSPPAVNIEPFFADDPAAAATSERPIITPTSAGDLSWDRLLDERPELTRYAQQHWLGSRGPLPALPDGFPAARDAYHRLAYSVVAEARRVSNTKFGLRYTNGGFGTPFFGDDEQVRIEGTRLVHQLADRVDSMEITTIAAAAEFLDIEPGTAAAEHDSPPLGDLDAPLVLGTNVGEFLGAWFGLAWAVLEELRLTPGAHDPERVQLWPGHFDAAMAMGDATSGARATYGMSPGDHNHARPYLYVGAWNEVDSSDPFWNAQGFQGAELGFDELNADGDPYATALGFFQSGYTRLVG